MKRLVLIASLCAIMILPSCANIKSVDVNTNSTEKKSETQNVSSGNANDKTISTMPTPSQADNAALVSNDTDIKSIASYNKHFYTGKAVVLTYHHISNEPFSGITIKPARFESDLAFLKDNGFNVISLKKLINCMNGTDTLPENAVVITFDDGIESVYKYAYPLLKKYNMHATSFIITSRTEAYTPSKNDYNPLSPDEIKEMYQSGLVDIQSHTDNSHDYVIINEKLQKAGKLAYRIYNPASKTYESEQDYKARVIDDLTKSSDIIFKYTGERPLMLCFPFGHYNKRVIELARQCGFEYFITTQSGYNRQGSNSKLIYRIRSGDAGLTSEKLIQNIVNCANNIKSAKPKKSSSQANKSTVTNSSNVKNTNVSPAASEQGSKDNIKQDSEKISEDKTGEVTAN